MQARWYDASLGRFISPDTIVPDPANPQSFNRYSYVNNQPINYNDPSGHFAVCFQQGTSTVEDETALGQICQDLSDQGEFGASGIYKIFENTEAGAIEALEWLNMMLAEELSGVSEPFVLVGFSWGGAGVLEFATMLNDNAGQEWNGNLVPQNLRIDALVTIDPVLSARQFFKGRQFYALDKAEIPGNVDAAYNVRATKDAYSGLPFDRSVDVNGALNVSSNTNHCSVAYASCKNVAGFPIGISDDGSGGVPLNQTTYGYIKTWFDFLPYNGEW